MSPSSRIRLRLRPSQLFGIADGRDYLHPHNAVHGDLKWMRNRSKAHLAIALASIQLNISVDDSGCGLRSSPNASWNDLSHVINYPLTSSFFPLKRLLQGGIDEAEGRQLYGLD